MHCVRGHGQILKQKLRGVATVRKDAPDLRSGKHHNIRALLLKELLHRHLIGQIQFPAVASDDPLEAVLLQQANYSRTHHAFVTGDIDRLIRIHASACPFVGKSRRVRRAGECLPSRFTGDTNADETNTHLKTTKQRQKLNEIRGGASFQLLRTLPS